MILVEIHVYTEITVTATHSHPPRILTTIAKTSSLRMTRPTSPYTSSSSDTDSMIASNNVSTQPTGTALRRLYFKTAKSGRSISAAATKSNPTNVPKVIVMNSSCNSTINTSTESASTHLTNITTTTDTETCDSLDLGGINELILHDKSLNHYIVR